MPPAGDRPAASRDDDIRAIAEKARGETEEPLDLEFLVAFVAPMRRVARSGGRLRQADLDRSEATGRHAALTGVSLASVVGGYLSASRIIWAQSFARGATAATGEAIFRAADAALAAVARGFGNARQSLVRQEESERREFIDDLLGGSGELAKMVARSDRHGLSITAPHTVIVARAVDGVPDAAALVTRVEQRLRVMVPDRDMLVTTKEADLVVVLGDRMDRSLQASDRAVLTRAAREISRMGRGRPVQVSIGPTLEGSTGIAESYRAARQGADLAVTLAWDEPIVRPERVAVYSVLLRDRHALVGLVDTVLSPLGTARGGAGPLLDTLLVYLGTGAVASETARRMNLSVRAVTYRLARIAALTGWDPTDPSSRLTLHVAAEGARLLRWPDVPL